ncbi:MAG TPA: DUF502 domain-containing protein [Kiloniellales bacterium]
MARRKTRNREPDGEPPQEQPPRPEHLRLGLTARLRNYFLAGVLITAPVSLTIWIAWNLIDYIDSRVTPLIPAKWNPETYLPFSVPGLGVAAMVVVLTLAGFLAAGFFGRALMRLGEASLARVPVVRSLYSGTKQIFETVLAQQSNAFRKVCLIEYPRLGTWAIGFVTGQTVGEVQRRTDDTVINVFIPATPNPTTGFLLFVPERDVHVLDITVEEGIKLVISGGILEPGEGELGGDWHLAEVLESRAKQVKAERAAKRAPRPKSALAGRLRNYFLAGILVTAPISITFWLVWKFVTFVDNRVVHLIPPAWNPQTYLPFDLPGLGLAVSVIGLTFIGFVTAGITGRMITRLGERLLSQVPVVRSIYSALKQIFETILAKKSRAFREVVLIEYPRKDVWALGFMTGATKGEIRKKVDSDVVNVFLPTTPNPTSGFLLFEPKNKIEHLEMTVEEGLKMVVSGGIVTPPDRGAMKKKAAAEAAVEPTSEPTAEGGPVVEPVVSRSAET